MSAFTGLGRRFSTGLEFLDMKIDGGIPVGTLLALAAPVRSQSELFIRKITSRQKLLYVSTTCPDEEELHDRVTGGDRRTDVSVAYADPETLLTDPTAYADRIKPESYVVIDMANSLEGSTSGDYLAFLNVLKRRVRDVDSIAILHCIESVAAPPSGRRLTLKRADQIWQLRMAALSNEIKTRLYITKARGQRAQIEPIPLVITDRVLIDTSRNIA